MPPMQRLDLDIVTEGILPLLGVEDILSLRRVNKLFYKFSKDWLLWKRLLEHLSIPTSPFFRHYETLVLKAIKLDDNFRDANTRIEHLQVASRWNDIGYRPLDAKFLLGGHYLVVCVRRKFKTVRDHVITIFQKGSPFYPPTFKIPSRAYCLDAKYLVYKGVPGIMISYVLRASLATSPSANLDDLEYDGDNGRGYDMVCNFISIESLKRMYDKANSANIIPSGVHMNLWLCHSEADMGSQVVRDG